MTHSDPYAGSTSQGSGQNPGQDSGQHSGRDPASHEVLDEARKATHDVADDLKHAARDAAGKASAEVSKTAEKAKETAAEEVGSIAAALRTAAGELRGGSLQERTFSQLADGLADASDKMRGKDMGAMLSEVNGFARRHPLAFLGGAALLGFAATRVIKASADGDSQGHTAGTTGAGMPSVGSYSPPSGTAAATPATSYDTGRGRA